MPRDRVDFEVLKRNAQLERAAYLRKLVATTWMVAVPLWGTIRAIAVFTLGFAAGAAAFWQAP